MSFAEVQREKCPLFYLFCDDGRVQQAVIAFAELKEFVPLSTGRSVFKAD